MIWFTSDTHFGHEVVLRSCERPWASVSEMNGALVDAINEHVEPGDTLYHLGDYSFKTTLEDAANLRKRISCKDVHLVPGNHDKDWAQPAVSWAFTVEKSITVLKIGKLKLVLSHYPMADWQGMSHGSIHLHGHIHSRGMQYNELNRMQGLYRYDVGGWTPTAFAPCPWTRSWRGSTAFRAAGASIGATGLTKREARP